jgi:hypothetical protein
MPPRRVLGATVVAFCLIGGAAPAETAHPSALRKITASGVGGVRLGATYAALRRRHLVARIQHGCEFGGPGTRSARLRAPLKGVVDFTLRSPRRVADIAVEGGATARGVGVGATIPQIEAAFPKARVDHSTDTVFGVTLVKVPKGAGGRVQFGVSTKTGRTVVVGIPFVAFCD